MKLKLVTAIAVGLLCTQAFADMNADAPQTLGQSMSNNAGANKQAGDAFLKANKANKGVITLADGLQYKVIKAGTGAKPTDSDVVVVEYSGRLIDGTVFDSSDKHGGSISFPVGQVIPGWTEALKLMPVGSEWEVYIPSALAYGDQGVPPTIGPNQTLIFNIKLKDIKK